MRGYQAPPLDGVWATAPYLHNGSVPTLHALLKSSERPRVFRRPASTDFANYDKAHVGWIVEPLSVAPDVARMPTHEARYIFDAGRFGLGNGGHTFGDKLTEGDRIGLDRVPQDAIVPPSVPHLGRAPSPIRQGSGTCPSRVPPSAVRSRKPAVRGTTMRKKRGPTLAWDRLEDRTCRNAGVFGSGTSDMASVIPTFTPLAFAAWQTNLEAQQATTTKANVAFYGDSITYNFAYSYGSDVWDREIAPLGAANYGVQGDMTQNLLWRLEYGNALANPPKVAVVGIGVNNVVFGLRTPAEVVAGIKKVVQTIRAASPSTQVLVLGVYPTGTPTNPFRTEEATINRLLAAYAPIWNVRFLDPGAAYIAPDGSIDADTVGEIHPNAQGYQVIANAIVPTIQAMLANADAGASTNASPTS